MQPNELPTRRLPEDPAEAVIRLAHEVNRLNGQVAALLAFIETARIPPGASRAEVLAAAHEVLPPIHLSPGPNTIADHASLTLASLYPEA